MSPLRPVPTTYRGTAFRSTLEADWAATFDSLEWYWEYEPVAVRLPDGTDYRPDFYLPSQEVWCEVKGPHNQRIKKSLDLQRAVTDEWGFPTQLVVVLRPPGPGDKAQWEGVLDEQQIVLVRCPECEHYGFMDFNGWWTCRRHVGVQPVPAKFWNAPGGALHWTGEVDFTRARR